MFNRHTHEWQEVERSYYPAFQGRATNVPSDEAPFMLYGRTIITYKCAVCGKREQDSLVGRVTQ